MTKKLFYATLGLMGVMGTLSIGVSNADVTVTQPYGHIEYELNGTGFEAQVITIKGDDGTVITMLDRNLGAKNTGIGCEDISNRGRCPANDETYGYHFQWGNNYGFDPNNSSIKNNAVSVSTSGVIWNDSYNNRGYYGGIFIKATSLPSDYWKDSIINSANHYGLWGGTLTESTDGFSDNKSTISSATILNGEKWQIKTDVINRRGPCPEGFHIPSYGEFLKIQNMMKNDGLKAHNLLMIPFVGYRGTDAIVYGLGYNVRIWSSSPYSVSNHNSRRLGLDINGNLDTNNTYRANAFPIRCFYDSYQDYTFSFTLMSEDIILTGGKINGGVTLSENVNLDSIGVMKDGYTLDGLFLTGTENAFDLDSPITGDITLYAKRTANQYPISFNTHSGTTVAPITGTYDSKLGELPITTRIGYTFSGWYYSGVQYTSGTIYTHTGGIELEAQRTVNDYIISFDGEDTTFTILVGDIGLPTQNKFGYKFDGWFDNKGNQIESIDSVLLIKELEAQGETKYELFSRWTPVPTYSGGGGHRTSLKTEDSNTSDENRNRETHQYEKNDNNKSIENNVVNEYSQEMKDAYKFAYEKGITTMNSIDKADMNGSLTRIAMAKMLSNFAINVLGRTPTDIEVPDFSDVSEQMNSDYDNGISLAYQLNIMGVNMPNNEFRPNDLVTRAEFGTALSRLLFGLSDGEGAYYETHLTKLKEEGIITNDNPNLEEARGYIMLMLMRSVK